MEIQTHLNCNHSTLQRWGKHCCVNCSLIPGIHIQESSISQTAVVVVSDQLLKVYISLYLQHETMDGLFENHVSVCVCVCASFEMFLSGIKREVMEVEQ